MALVRRVWWGQLGVLTFIAALGLLPWRVAPVQAAPFAYVAGFEPSLSVLDTATNSVVTTVRFGSPSSRTAEVALHPGGTFVYVTHYDSIDLGGTVSVIDTATNTVVGTVPVGSSAGSLVLHPAGTFVYVVNGDGRTVSVLDTATNMVVKTVPVEGLPSLVVAHPAGTFVYVVGSGGFGHSNISVIDTTSHTVTATVPVPGGAFPSNIAMHPAGRFVYVADLYERIVSVMDTTTNTVVATLPVGTLPEGIYPGYLAVHPAGNFLYVATSDATFETLGMSGTVSVIDTATHNVVASVPVGGGPWNLTVHPDGTYIYVANEGGGTISVLDTATNTVSAAVPHSFPFRVAVHPAGTFLYVGFLNFISVIDTAINAVITATRLECDFCEYMVYAATLSVGPEVQGGSLTLNQSMFSEGDTLTLSATTYAGAAPRPVDVYVSVRLPDGTRLFVDENGSLTRETRRFARNWTVEALRGEIFRYTFGNGEPVGTYTWEAYFTEPGTLNKRVGLTSRASFTFSP